MQPQVSWTDLQNSKVGIWGYGVEGKASEAKLKSLGINPVIVDESLAETSVDKSLSFDSGGYDKLAKCDYVLKAPGISRYGEQAKKISSRVPLLGATGVWLQSIDHSKVVCITGTKGKSTTSALIAAILEAIGFKVFLGGNIGRAPYEADSDIDYDYWVIETSSYQVTDLSCGPKVVGITSLHPDHLNWHGDIETYYRDKLSIISLPGLEHLVVNADDHILSQREEVADAETTTSDDLTELDGVETTLRGKHNRSNMALALQCAAKLVGADNLLSNQKVYDALVNFAGLDHRFQTVGIIGDVEFINDSLSTNVLPTIAAMQALAGENVAVIVGGFDRGVDSKDLVDYLLGRADPTFVACIPETGRWIAEALAEAGMADAHVVPFDDLDSACLGAFEWAKAQDAGFVLLSPAAASFNAFKDYKDRGNTFARIVEELASAQ